MKKHKTTALLMTAVICCSAAMSPLPSAAFPIPDIITVSAAEDYAWSSYLKKSADWFGSAEALGIANDILKFQLSDGGWRKLMADTSQTGSWAKSTIDNDATTSQIRFLSRCYTRTGDSKYKDAMLRGIDLLLNGQYSNGGWPQVFNDAGTYHAHITFNDGAMMHVLFLMQEMRDKSGDFTFIDDTRSQKASAAIQKAIDCILQMQIELNGVKTAWCQQHDEFTLAPAPARAYELPSVCTSESVNIILFLRSEANGNPAIMTAANAAVEWFKKVQLNGIKVVEQNGDRVVVSDTNASPLWARFYDLQNQQPLFVDRDGSIHKNMAELSQERRTGYSWYGNWGKNVVNLEPLSDTPPEPVYLNGTLIQNLTVYDTGNAADWSIQQGLGTGAKIYGDRDFTYVSQTEWDADTEYIRTACDSKNSTADLASFTAASDASVYVFLDTRVKTVPAWLSAWEKCAPDTAIASSNDVTFDMYKLDVNAGETVTLGTNGMSGNCMCYAAAVVKRETVTTTTTTVTTTTETTMPSIELLRGDVDCSGDVNVNDVILLSRYISEDKLVSVTPQGIENAECDRKEGITSSDITVILQYIAHLIDDI